MRIKRTCLILLALLLLPAPAFALDPMKNTDPDKYYIELDTGKQVVTVYQRDDNGEYTRIVRRMLCTSGRREATETNEALPTPSGTWKIGTRERFGKFAAFAGEYARYWTQLVGGVYFHSVMFSSRDIQKLKSGPLSHLGTDGSHGCVRLYVEDAKWLYYNACFGTTVRVFSSTRNKNLVKALKTDMRYVEYKAFQANIYDVEPLPDRTAWVTVDGTQLRTGNGTNDKLIKRLSAGTEFIVLQEGDPWIKVSLNGKEGYVRRCYITYEQGALQAEEKGHYVSGTTYLYAEPNTRSKRIYKVPSSSTINVVDDTIDEGKWTLINFQGTLGYMQSRSIRTGWATLPEYQEGYREAVNQ